MHPLKPIPELARYAGGALFTGLVLIGPMMSGGSGALVAQSGEEVLRTAFDRYEERLEGVENYTVVQETMGFESATYFERTEVDGRSVFVARVETGNAAGQNAPGDPYTEFLQLAERAEREGSEVVDGEETHVVTVTDFEGIDVWNPSGDGSAGQFSPERMSFFVDTDDYLIRRMVMSGESAAGGGSGDATFTADFRDYRDIEGVLHPFLMEITVEGLQGQMSPEEQEEMRRSLEQMRQQLEEMSPQQREMMERMMGGQMEQVENMMASGAMDLTVQVTEIRVNEGPPSDQR